MSTVRKFTFDLDFDAPEEPAKPEVEEEEAEPEDEIPTFSEEDMERARAEGVEAGKEEGRRQAADATEQKMLETLESACASLADIYNAQTEANREIGREMISVATAIARKMFPDLNARNALGEVERVVQETLKAVTEEPRIQIMVNPELREPLTERLGTMTNRAGFEGKVFVNPDPAMPLGDCRIEWSNGAAVRDVEEMWQMIDRIIEENLHDSPDDEDTASAPTEDNAPEPVSEPGPGPEPEQQAEETARAEPEMPTPAETGQPVENAAPAEEATPEPEIADAPLPEEDNAETEAETPSLTEELRVPAAPEADAPPTGPGIEADEVDAFETPNWQDAVGESTGVNAPIEPAPEPEPEPAPAAEVREEAPGTDGPGAHGPSFAPNVDDVEEPAAAENTDMSQDVSMENRAAPIPHVDDVDGGASAAEGDAAAGEQAPPPYSDPDPVSSVTQAAILDAQGTQDDDEENPSGG